MMHPVAFVLMWLCLGALVVMAGLWVGQTFGSA